VCLYSCICLAPQDSNGRRGEQSKQSWAKREPSNDYSADEAQGVVQRDRLPPYDMYGAVARPNSRPASGLLQRFVFSTTLFTAIQSAVSSHGSAGLLYALFKVPLNSSFAYGDILVGLMIGLGWFSLTVT